MGAGGWVDVIEAVKRQMLSGYSASKIDSPQRGDSAGNGGVPKVADDALMPWVSNEEVVGEDPESLQIFYVDGVCSLDQLFHPQDFSGLAFVYGRISPPRDSNCIGLVGSIVFVEGSKQEVVSDAWLYFYPLCIVASFGNELGVYCPGSVPLDGAKDQIRDSPNEGTSSEDAVFSFCCEYSADQYRKCEQRVDYGHIVPSDPGGREGPQEERAVAGAAV